MSRGVLCRSVEVAIDGKHRRLRIVVHVRCVCRSLAALVHSVVVEISHCVASVRWVELERLRDTSIKAQLEGSAGRVPSLLHSPLDGAGALHHNSPHRWSGRDSGDNRERPDLTPDGRLLIWESPQDEPGDVPHMCARSTGPAWSSEYWPRTGRYRKFGGLTTAARLLRLCWNQPAAPFLRESRSGS